MTLQTSIEKHGTFRYLRWHLARPERRNALGTTMAQALLDALVSLQTKTPDGIRAIVITADRMESARRAIWIAGGDLKELAALNTPNQVLSYAKTMRTFCQALEQIPLPVVAFVDGAAIGGGAELAMAADIRIATHDSTLEWKQLKVGLSTGYGGGTRLVELVGKAHAQRLLYFCETVSATEATNLGLFHHLVASLDGCLDLVSGLEAVDPEAFAAQKRILHLSTSTPPGNSAWADYIFQSIWRNPGHSKGLDDFLKDKSKEI